MQHIFSISDLPNTASVYAMCSGKGRSLYVAYIGIADKLKSRITQHLIRRDSSIVTGVTAVSLNPDLITEVRWWCHPKFSERSVLEAAELVAFDILNPVLRSRGAITERAKSLYQDLAFRNEISKIFQNEPSGILSLTEKQTALERISLLEKRVEKLEAEFERLKESKDE